MHRNRLMAGLSPSVFLGRHKRKVIQLLAALLFNLNLPGFASGSIYKGPLKAVCAPGLNCYSCPGAVAACPIGALQAAAMDRRKLVPFYVGGWLILIGVTIGRLVCGFLCPFGWLQELLHRIPTPKMRLAQAHRYLKKLKYAVLAVFVAGIPIGYALFAGGGFPAFCQWICPAGTLEAGIPLVTLNARIGSAAGWLFLWKCGLALVFLAAAILIFRPFCKYVCPLGAIYAWMNRLSLVTIDTDEAKCTGCGHCTAICRMQATSPLDAECIRCGECVRACPMQAMEWRVCGKKMQAGGNRAARGGGCDRPSSTASMRRV